MNTTLTNFGLGAWATGQTVISRKAWEPDSGRHSLTVTVAGAASWNAVSNVDWLQVRLGKIPCDFCIYVDANDADNAEDRVGTVTITFEDGTTEEVKVKQEATTWKPNSITPSIMFFGQKGGSCPFELTSSEDWMLTPQCDWLSIRKEVEGGKTISVGSGLATRRPNQSPAAGEVVRDKIDLLCVAGENTTGKDRVFTLQVRNTFNGAQAYVHQMAEEPTLGNTEEIPANISFDAAGEPVKIDINPNTLFTVSSDADWCHAAMVHEEEGDSVKDYIEITADENEEPEERTANVAISLSPAVVTDNAEEYAKEISVTQAGAPPTE